MSARPGRSVPAFRSLDQPRCISGRTRHKCASPDGLGRARLRAWTKPTWDGDDLFLDAVDAIVLSALEAIGDNQEARFALFKKLLAVAQEAACERGS